MSTENKITVEEFAKIQELGKRKNALSQKYVDFGWFENNLKIEKENALAEHKAIILHEEEIKKELFEKYGDVNIDQETGIITVNQKEEVEQPQMEVVKPTVEDAEIVSE